MFRRTPIFLAVILLSPIRGFAASDVSNTAAQFLKLPMSVRAAAMGEAFTAVSDDASAIAWNIAGLSQLDDPEINLLHTSQWEGMNDEFIGAAVPLPSDFTLGLGFIFNHVSAFNSTNDPSAVTGSVSNMVVEAGVAKKFGRFLSAGWSGKIMRSKLADASSAGLAMDAGILATMFERVVTAGLLVQNVGYVSGYGSDGQRERLPTAFRLGLAVRPVDGEKLRALASVEARGAFDENVAFQSGAELGLGPLQKSIAFRMGYQSNALLKDLGEGTGFSFGIGLRFSSLQFDYALVPFGSLGNTERFSMTYRFGKHGQGGEGAKKQIQVGVQSKVSDIKNGSLKDATFDIKPQARLGIKNWALDITDSKGALVRRYTGKGVPPRTLKWDGKDAEGNVVSGGVFSNYQLRTIDKNGEQAVSTDEPVFDLNAGGLDLRGMDPRVLAMRPIAPSLNDLAAPTGAPQTQEAPRLEGPRLPTQVQPEGRRGALRIPAILFESGSSILRPEYQPYLDEVVALIGRYPKARVYVEGHADSEGTALQEVRLSQDRADVVLRYLVEKRHVASNYLYARGHGESAPEDNGSSESAHAKNRRVDIVILTQ